VLVNQGGLNMPVRGDKEVGQCAVRAKLYDYHDCGSDCIMDGGMENDFSVMIMPANA
jgi:hypothetical protein